MCRGVLYIVGKVLKCRCLKWPCMSHLDICITSYGRKKGRESNCHFDSRPQKVRNRPDSGVCRWSATHRWKSLKESYSLLQTLSQSEVGARSYERPKSQESKPRQFRDLVESRDKEPFGRGRGGATQKILYGGRWWLPPSPGRGELSESKVARGLSQQQKDAE